MRRTPDLKWLQNLQLVQDMTVTQAAILQSAARLLKPGGRLVYATCSMLVQENEAIAQAVSEANKELTAMGVGDLLTGLEMKRPAARGGGAGGRRQCRGDGRGAWHTWIQLIVEMDAACDRSWPVDVAHAIRHAHTVREAKDRLAKLDRFAGREKRS